MILKKLLKITIIAMSMIPAAPATAQTSGLTQRQLHLATCAALEAQGDLVRLEPAIVNALDGGVTINELKEAFSHLYAYTGFPRSLNAISTLQKILEHPKAGWAEGKAWTRPAAWDDAQKALKDGTDVQTALAGQPITNAFSPQSDYYLKAHLFGDIFAGDNLTPKDRELVTVSALSALKGAESQLAFHKGGAVKMGNSQEAVDELCRYLSENGLSQNDCSAEAQAGTWAKGEPNAYGKFFIGQSYLADMTPKNLNASSESVQPYINVTFEPGCRNNWHVHHGARQIIICVAGKGWYQEWGKPAIELNAGDVIDVPEGVKHWHGAQKDSWFQHLATHVEVENTQPGSETNEWLEPVTDEEYNKL